MNNKRTLQLSLMGLGAAAVLSLIIYAGLYAAIKNSNAYLCATVYINQSSSVKNEFGEIEKISLSPNNFYFKSDGADGKAKMKINIIGKMKEGSIVFSLKQESGKWTVQEANVFL